MERHTRRRTPSRDLSGCGAPTVPGVHAGRGPPMAEWKSEWSWRAWSWKRRRTARSAAAPLLFSGDLAELLVRFEPLWLGGVNHHLAHTTRKHRAAAATKIVRAVRCWDYLSTPAAWKRASDPRLLADGASAYFCLRTFVPQPSSSGDWYHDKHGNDHDPWRYSWEDSGEARGSLGGCYGLDTLPHPPAHQSLLSWSSPHSAML